MIAAISPKQLDRVRSSDEHVELIDVRTPAEFEAMHVGGARNVPLDQLTPQAFAQRNVAEPLYLICKAGGRSKQASERLAAAGIAVCSVDGGTDAWAAAGLPVVRGKEAVSLERQRRHQRRWQLAQQSADRQQRCE